MINYLLLLIPIGVIAFLITRNVARRTWDKVNYLKQKANTVKTKEEIEVFFKEFSDERSKIYNEYAQAELNRVEGYLRGLYQHFKNDGKYKNTNS